MKNSELHQLYWKEFAFEDLLHMGLVIVDLIITEQYP